MNLLASPPTFQPAPQPEVTSITGAPLLQADIAGDTVYLAFRSSLGGPVAVWSASTPNAFQISTAKDTSSDLTTSSDGTLFALRSNALTEIRGTDLSLIATPTAYELENIPGRVSVPGLTLHPSGALLYEPFLDGPAPLLLLAVFTVALISATHTTGSFVCVFICQSRWPCYPQILMGCTEVFLTTDENGQRLFAITTSGLTIVQLANVPLESGRLRQIRVPQKAVRW
ncbi:MAG TPA: hypothetical protein VGH37_09090 [Candidatus Acidoferrum sp.]|jgi:hypothetical protein